ncbi:hypothetical protein EU523_01910 [Candidatus Heimdallarchaeota archaeon]|nr:MAG: hypothetical protein EU523_01910 [Candidatus Heimdallarchaeota archaeon]
MIFLISTSLLVLCYSSLRNAEATSNYDNTNLEINDFSLFKILNNLSDIDSEKTQDVIKFQKTANEENPYSDYNEQIQEDYSLDLTEFGNCSSFELELEFSFSCFDNFTKALFSLEVFTTNVGNNLVYAGLFDDSYFLSSELHYRNSLIYSRSIYCSELNRDSLIIEITKNGRKMTCQIKEKDNDVLLKRTIRSNKNYIYTNEVQLNFNADSNFWVEASSFSGIFTIENKNWDALKTRFDAILGAIVFISVLIILLLLYLFFTRWQGKKTKSIHKIETKFEEFEEQITKELKNKLEHLIYNGEEKSGQTCGICKLNIKKGALKLQCPSCKTLFHSRHLVDWLKDHKECPICKEKLIDEI